MMSLLRTPLFVRLICAVGRESLRMRPTSTRMHYPVLIALMQPGRRPPSRSHMSRGLQRRGAFGGGGGLRERHLSLQCSACFGGSARGVRATASLTGLVITEPEKSRIHSSCVLCILSSLWAKYSNLSEPYREVRYAYVHEVQPLFFAVALVVVLNGMARSV